MKRFFLLAMVASGAAWAQVRPLIPDKHIPPSVMLELRSLETQMDLALVHDCAPERCVSKGCVYRDHVVVDLPRNSSLPGLQAEQGLGAVPPQEYLTSAACDFAHEKSVSAKDAQALVKRLEQRLSKGWLKVTVSHQLLEPVSPSLAESPTPPAPPPVEPPKPPAPPEAPKEWDAKLALRELWVTLLPHFAWMIAVFLATLAALVLIWAARRLGKETLEEKAMAASLLQPQAAPEPTPATPAVEKSEGGESPDGEAAFVDAQKKAWTERIDEAHLSQSGGALAELLKSWLKDKEFPMLAKAILLFGDRLSSALPNDGELAARKVEFAHYLKVLDESTLPGDAAFFRALQQHTISSAVLSQSDAQTYQSIASEFGASGIAKLVTSLGGRPGALLYALVPRDLQMQVARTLPSPVRLLVAGHLLDSNRISKDESAFVLSAVDSARAGTPLPQVSPTATHEIVDRGHEVDAASALSVLLPFLSAGERERLLAARAKEGVLPAWYEDICFGAMLDNLPSAETRADVLLQVDVKALAGWLSLSSSDFKEGVLAALPESFRNAVRVSDNFTSRDEQLRLAFRGQAEIAGALKKLYAKGVTTFHDLAGAA